MEGRARDGDLAMRSGEVELMRQRRKEVGEEGTPAGMLGASLVEASIRSGLSAAGATAVAVGTANFIDPETTVKVAEGIEEYMRKNHVEDINELVGAVR